MHFRLTLASLAPPAAPPQFANENGADRLEMRSLLIDICTSAFNVPSDATVLPPPPNKTTTREQLPKKTKSVCLLTRLLRPVVNI